MIDLYYWPAPNGHKISMMLEECDLDYTIHPVNITAGDQFRPDFLKLSPNNRIPAIVDHDPVGGGPPIKLFESGAILLYLAEKTGRFFPTDLRERYCAMKWLMWQMGGLGPMAGQNHHFGRFAPEKIPYAIDRYRRETYRLYGVLDGALAKKSLLLGTSVSLILLAIHGLLDTNGKRWISTISRISNVGLTRLRPDPRLKLHTQRVSQLGISDLEVGNNELPPSGYSP